MSLGEYVSHDSQREDGDDDAEDGPGDDILGMVEVIADPGETDPEGEDDHGKLNERSQYFQHSVAESNWSSLNVGHLVKPSLEVDNQKGATVKTEAGMARQEREMSLMELLLVLLIVPAHCLLVLLDEFIKSIFIFTSFIGEFWVAECDVVRPQTTNLIFGQLREEQGGKGSKSEVTKVSVELHSDPGRSVVPYWIDSPRIAVIMLLSIHP